MSEKLIITCLNPKGYNITEKKEYQVEEIEDRGFWIINDLGKKRRYSKTLFSDPKHKVKKEESATISVFGNSFLFKGDSFGKEIRVEIPSEVPGLAFNATNNCSTEFVNGMAAFSRELLVQIKSFRKRIANIFELDEFAGTKFFYENRKNASLSVDEIVEIFKSNLLRIQAEKIASRSICHFIASSTLNGSEEQVMIMDEFWPLVTEMLNKIHGNYGEEESDLTLVKRVRENPNSHNIVHNYLI